MILVPTEGPVRVAGFRLTAFSNRLSVLSPSSLRYSIRCDSPSVRALHLKVLTLPSARAGQSHAPFTPRLTSTDRVIRGMR